MKLPKAEPATPEEAAEMLAVQRAADPSSPLMMALDPETRLDGMENIAARVTEAENLDDFYAEPLPSGYTVIFTIDAQQRAIYSLRPPPAAYDDRPRLVAVDIRVVLAEAWDHYSTRWPDGVTPQMLERLVHEPSAPG